MKTYQLAIILVVLFFVGCTQQQIDNSEVNNQTTDQNVTPNPTNNVTNDSQTDIVPTNITVKNETNLTKITVENDSNKPIELQRGVTDPSFEVDIYASDKAWTGYTLFADNHDLSAPRVVEVNMFGEIVWEYKLPAEFSSYTNPGFDVELLREAPRAEALGFVAS